MSTQKLTGCWKSASMTRRASLRQTTLESTAVFVVAGCTDDAVMRICGSACRRTFGSVSRKGRDPRADGASSICRRNPLWPSHQSRNSPSSRLAAAKSSRSASSRNTDQSKVCGLPNNATWAGGSGTDGGSQRVGPPHSRYRNRRRLKQWDLQHALPFGTMYSIPSQRPQTMTTSLRSDLP